MRRLGIGLLVSGLLTIPLGCHHAAPPPSTNPGNPTPNSQRNGPTAVPPKNTNASNTHRENNLPNQKATPSTKTPHEGTNTEGIPANPKASKKTPAEASKPPAPPK